MIRKELKKKWNKAHLIINKSIISKIVWINNEKYAIKHIVKTWNGLVF